MSASSAPVQAIAVLTDYKSRVQHLQILIAESRSRKTLALATSLACAVTLVAALIIALKGVSLLFAVIPILLIVAIWQFQTFLRYCVTLIGSARRSAFYERGIDRIEDNWGGKGSAGLKS